MVPQAAAPRERRDGDRPREDATASTARAESGREREPLSNTHRAERASRRRGRVAVERHAAASAAARPSRRYERQRGAAGSGAASAARRRPPPERKRPRRRPHAESASRRALRTAPRERAAATEERRPSAAPPRARWHDRAGARSAGAAPQAAAPVRGSSWALPLKHLFIITILPNIIIIL